MGESIEAAKNRLRGELEARRRGLASDVVARASAAACTVVLRAPLFASARALVLYAARRGELDPTPLASAAVERGVPTYYPRLEGPSLVFRRARPSALTPGAFGIREPPVSGVELPRDEAGILFVVPGLAFDRYGNRLGSGRGYFDRALIGYPSAMRVGMGWSFAVQRRLPSGPWDVPMHAVATEEGLLVVQPDVGVSQGEPS